VLSLFRVKFFFIPGNSGVDAMIPGIPGHPGIMHNWKLYVVVE